MVSVQIACLDLVDVSEIFDQKYSVKESQTARLCSHCISVTRKQEKHTPKHSMFSYICLKTIPNFLRILFVATFAKQNPRQASQFMVVYATNKK